MEALRTLGEHWFDLLQSLGIIGSFAYTALSFNRDQQSRKISNKITITQNHRELWGLLLTDTDLGRILDPNANLDEKPLTTKEQWFINLLILHLGVSVEAIKMNMMAEPEKLRQDIQWIFSLPLPKQAWQTMRLFSDHELADLIESCTAQTEPE